MAKTSNILNTTLFALYLGTDGAETKIMDATDAQLTINHAPRETTNKDDSGWKTSLEGLRSATGSASFYFSSDTSAGYGVQDFYETCVTNRNTIHAIFKTSNADDTTWEGDIYITDISISSSAVEDNVTASISFEFTGAVTMLNT